MDEVLTAIFSMGRGYADVPVQTLFAIADLHTFFSVQPGVSCSQIAQTVATESVHPPLFFCLLHGWMTWLHPDANHWIWALRAFPALMGVGAIATLYVLNRIAISPAAGLFGAALMAVSPFAVYLSQEARHYTLPMLLITLALVGLVQIQQDIQSQRQLRPAIWIGWSVVNILSLYVHYFCILALVAQVLALGIWMMGQRHRIQLRYWLAMGGAIAPIALSYLPWLPTVISHFSRPETDWLIPHDPDWTARIAPLYQTLTGWVLMVIALPVEDQPLAIAIPAILIMLVFSIWLMWQAIRGWKSLWSNPSVQPSVVLLSAFTLCVLAQFFAIVYILNKDITVVPRYNFVYYPGVCALLGACLVQPNRVSKGPLPWRRWGIVLLAGLISSALVVNDFVFQKPYNPATVAQTMRLDRSTPMIMATSYRSLQEIALGLSFALELQRFYSDSAAAPIRFSFLDRRDGTAPVWRSLATLPQPLPLPLNLWIVAPEIRKRDYPQTLKLAGEGGDRSATICRLDPEEFHRLGFPYQLYRCS
jgi:uncharacterized membrane protein